MPKEKVKAPVKKRVTTLQKQIKKLKKNDADPLRIEQKREQIRIAKGKTATRPGTNPASAYSAAEFADQGSYNQALQNSQLGSANQTDEYGNQYQVSFDENGQPIINRNFGEQQQGVLDNQNAYQNWLQQMGQQSYGQAQDAMSSQYGYGGLQDVMGSQDLQAERRRIEDAYYQDQERLMGGQMQREKEDFEQMAAERGWTPGSEVYNEQKQLLNQSQDSTRQGWANQAQQAGLQEMQGQYGLSAEERARQIKEYEAQRYGSFQEAQQFMGSAGGPQAGQFQQAQFGQVAPTNYGQLALGYGQMQQQPWLDQQKYNADMAMLQAQMAGQGGGGGGGEELTAQQQMDMKLAYEQSLKDRGLGGYYNPDNGGTNWAGAAGGFFAGVGSGVGSYLAS